MKMGRRILSCMLAFAMMLSCVGINAYAAATDDLTTDNFSLDISQADSTLTVALVCNKDVTGWGAGGGKMSVADANGADAGSYFTLTNVSTSIGDKNDSVQNAEWSSTANTTNGGDSLSAGTWTTYTYTVSSEVPDGDYTFTMAFTNGDNYDGTDDMNDYSISGQSVSATYTVGSTTPGVAEAYTATLSPATTTVNNDGTSTVSVDVVVGGITGSFASTEIKLEYDPDYLTFKAEGSSCKLNANVPDGKSDQLATFTTAENDDGTQTLLIRDYGGNMAVDTNGTTAYTVNFTTVKGGTTDISLTSAGFSKQENAASENLTYVTDTSSKVNVTINHKATISVDGTEGTTTYVAPNDKYTYQISDYDATKYTYTVSATEGGSDVAEGRISVSDTGLVTITDVTGELAVTITATAKSYTITWADNENAITSDKPATQTYGTGITFDVKAGQAPNGATDGLRYDVKAYLTEDTQKTPVTVTATPSDDVYAARTYTIAADAITGYITIEVTKVDVSASETTITINGEYSELSKDGSPLSSGTLNVNKNTEVTLTLNKEAGYTYTVQTKVGEADAQDVSVGEDGSFTIDVGDEALTLIITKTLDTNSLAVSEYVQLDGKTMWLVKINGLTETSGKTYTYKDNENAAADSFYWSDKYTFTDANVAGAYCFLVVTDTGTDADSVKIDVAGKIGLTNTAATSISYDGNVNLTKSGENAVIDVNDAQLVWNMYSAVYDGISTDVTAQKFLEADMTADGSLNTDDAAAVVAQIK